MTFEHNTSLPESVRTQVPAAALSVFRLAFNESISKGNSELLSYIRAYSAVEKDAPGVGDVHVNRPIGSVPPKKKEDEEKDDPGTQDVHVDTPEEVLIPPAGPVPLPMPGSVAKRISGHSKINLNQKGDALAHKLGKRLSAKGGLDVLHTSDLPRAVQTRDAIAEQATDARLAHPTPDLRPQKFPAIEGKQSKDVQDLVKHFIYHPDETPDGGESINDAAQRQLGYIAKVYQDSQDHPNLKFGAVMHGRGAELLKAWVDAGMPKDFKLDPDDVYKPDDKMDHADVSRLHKGKLKPVDLDDDDELKPGMYAILHSLTDDDNPDSGNADLKKYMPPIEVHRATKSAWDAGVAVDGITAPLAEQDGLYETEIRKIDEYFLAVELGSITPTPLARDAWGGSKAKAWTKKILRKIDLTKYNPDQSRASNGEFGEGGDVVGTVSARVQRAIASQNVAGKKEQDIADKSEEVLSRALGLPRTKDNSAFDLRNDDVGIEVKTLVNGKNEKITMSKDALGRKLAEQRGDGIKAYTVVVDRRSGGMSGPGKYYVREGLGSFRLGSMTPISLSALKDMVRG